MRDWHHVYGSLNPGAREPDPIKSAAGLRERLGDVESTVLLVSRGDSTVFTTIRRS